MLVLSRKKNEVIKIGNLVELIVVDIRGDKVRLGIEAPAEVPVHRMEVAEAIARAENSQRIEQEKAPHTDIGRGDDQAAR